MNPQKLSEAVVHWTSYEMLCDRQTFLSEAGLRLPIGQFLQGSQSLKVIPEVSLPHANGKNPKRFDYCLRRGGDNAAIRHALESKWVGKAARPSLAEEVFDDMYRLASLQWPGQTEPCERWLVIAGVEKYIRSGLVERRFHHLGGTVPAFQGILDFDSEASTLHRIYTSQTGQPVLPWAEKWKGAAEDLAQTELLSSLCAKRMGKYPALPSPDDMVAYVWRMSAPPGAGHRPLSTLFPMVDVEDIPAQLASDAG